MFVTLGVDLTMSFVCASSITSGTPAITLTSASEGMVDPLDSYYLNGGTIAGIVIGSIIVMVLVAVIIW